jgi:putative ABC transport system permease protein
MQEFVQDIRVAIRSWRRKPGFTFTVLLTIALGVGSTTAIFSVVNGVMLSPLPHEDADRLVVLWETDRRYTPPTTRGNVSGGNFADWRRQTRSFEGIGAYSIGRATLTGLGEPEMVTRAWVTSDFLPLLRARPVLGRVFAIGEDTPEAHFVVVLSHHFWQRRYGGDPDVVGRKLTLSSDSYEIVGVLDPSVDLLARRVQLWTPYRIAQSDFEDRHSHFLNVLARLRPRVSHRQAQAEMDAVANQIRLEYAEAMTGRGVNVVPLHDELIGNVRPTLLALLGAALVMLLIAAVNVASLLLVRAIGRRREVAVKSALGAGRGRIIRQSLAESLTLSLAGGAMGVTLAAVGTDTLLALAPDNMPRVSEVGMDLRVLAFAIGVSVFTGVVIGLLPALQSANVGVAQALAAAGRWTASGERRRLRQALAVSELALSMALLVGAGLLTQTFWQLVSVDPGFASDHILTAGFRLPRTEYPDITRISAFHDELLGQVRALPQVNSAGLTRFLPLSDGPWTFSIDVEDLPPVPEGERRAYAYHPISSDHFRAAGITLLQGRDFTAADGVDAVPVVIINQAMKQQFWPDEDPLGERIRFHQDTVENRWREIVGIVNDVRHEGLHLDARPAVFGPQEQAFDYMLDRMRLVVRTSSDPMQIAQSVRGIVGSIDPNLAVADIRTMAQLVASSVAQPRFSMWLILSFAGVAVLLALIGTYGVISYTVRQRLPELGLRIALGAQTRAIGRLVLSEGMTLAAIGIAVGVVGALAFARLLESLLFGISTTDPLTYCALSVFLAGAAAVACYVPARRAASADPMVVMRGE